MSLPRRLLVVIIVGTALQFSAALAAAGEDCDASYFTCLFLGNMKLELSYGLTNSVDLGGPVPERLESREATWEISLGLGDKPLFRHLFGAKKPEAPDSTDLFFWDAFTVDATIGFERSLEREIIGVELDEDIKNHTEGSRIFWLHIDLRTNEAGRTRA